MGYSSVKLYKDMVKALRPAKTIRTKVTPVSSAPATGWQAADRVTKKALELYLQSQKEEKEKQDISARMQMFRDYNKPQAEFDPSKYGQTPDQLRDTGYKTVNYATTGEGDFGGDNVYDGDEPLSRDPEEAKAWQTLYKEEADKTQNRFDKENPYGMDLVNKNNYNSVDTNSSLDRFFGMEKDRVEGPKTSEMRMVLMGDSIGRRDAETKRLRAIEAAAEARVLSRGDKITDRNADTAAKIEIERSKTPKQTKEYKNAVAMGLVPGTPEFNAFIKRASKLVQDPVNAMWTSNAKSLSKTFDEWTSKGREAPVFLAKVGDLRGVLSRGVTQGYGQKFLNSVAAIAKRTGVSIDTKNLTGAQVAGSLINQLVVPRVKDLGVKPTDKDLQFIIDIFPNINNEKGANDLILRVLELDSKRNIARSDFAASWLKANAKNDPYGLKFNDDLKEFYKGNDTFKEFVPPAWVLDKKGGAGDTKAGAGDTIVKITSDEDYDKLKPGQEFIDPDGNRRKKPNG
jgi:hypothetical protein